MNRFIVELDEGGAPQCLIEVRGVSFEAAEEIMHSCMREVEGLRSVGCSGGVTTELLISGNTVRSVIAGVHYCVSFADAGVVVPTSGL